MPTLVSPFPTCVYPDFKQNIGKWASDLYADNTEPTTPGEIRYDIARVGCHLTVIANLLRCYGAQNVDPRELNNWLNNNNGYDSANGPNPQSIKGYVPLGGAGPVMSFVTAKEPSESDFLSKIDESLSKHWPVILQIKAPASASGIHYVVAIDVIESSPEKREYVIKDPYDSPNSLTRLDVSSNIIKWANFYKPADGKIRSSLTIKGHSPIAYVLMDENGRRLGYDPVLNQQYREIPNGSYIYNPPFWDPVKKNTSTNQGGGLDLEVPEASAGNYRLIVYGVGNGPYEIETFYNDEQNQTNTSTVNGTIQTGTTVIYDIQLRQGNIDVTINDHGLVMPSSGGGFGLVLLLILLVAGGVSIPLIRSRARKKITSFGIPRQAILVGVDGSRNNIASTDFVIGRASNSSLCLKDSSVSRNHARIRYAQGQWFIQDLGSGGGTYVNGTRINAAKLQNGDRIRIGSSEFEFRA